MTRTAVVPGRSVLSDQEWARTVEQRLRALANPQTQRVGEFVLSSRGGQLVATRPGQAPLEVGGVAEPEVIPLGPDRGGYAMDLESLAEAVGYPEDAPRPESENDIRQWLLSNLFGPISASRVPRLPWSHLFDGVAELLADPSFDNASTFFGALGISHDAVFGRLKPGSGRISADGTTHTFVSNAIEVDQGELLPVGVWTFYESVVAAANSDAIRVSVRGYSVNPETGVRTHVGTELIDAIASPAGESADHPDADDDWVHLEGAYTVPLGVNEVVVEVTVTPAATAGEVWVDDASAKKTRDGMPQAWIKNLIPDLSSLWNGLTGMVDSLLTHLGLPLVGDFWDRLFDLSDEIAWIQDRAESAREDLTALLSDLLTNPAAVLGSIPQTLVNGLSNVVSQFNQVRDILGGQIVTPINDAIQDIKDAWSGVHTGISDVFDDVRDTWRNFWNGIFKTPEDNTTRTLSEFGEAALTISDAVSTVEHSQSTLQSTILLPRKQPLWVSKWPDDDVAFPVALIDQTISPGLNTLILIPVTSTTDRVYESVKFATGVTLPMTQCFVGIYSVNTETGEATLIQNLGDVRPQLSTVANQHSLELPEQLIAARGDNFYIGILQVGGASADFYGSSNNTALSDYPESHPAFLGAKVSGSLSSLPTTITAASTVLGDRIWGALGYGISPPPPPPSFYLYNFNHAGYPPDAPLPAPWTPNSNYIIKRSPVLPNMLSSMDLVPGAALNTYHTSKHGLPTTGINQQMQIRGGVGVGSSRRVRYMAILHQSASSADGVYGYLEDYAPTIGNKTRMLQIGTLIGGSMVLRAQTSWSTTITGQIELTMTALGNGEYHLSENGDNKEINWTDSGGIFPRTAMSKYGSFASWANTDPAHVGIYRITFGDVS